MTNKKRIQNFLLFCILYIRACLKKLSAKYTAKWRMQITEMFFKTRYIVQQK
ncbi:DUF6783 domain-containing protein [Blautia sp.]|uniref:DUF6783 domain-containing protein n=1 Tax=Blautia sp. TaxID=1955243 RepID=UPI003A869F52